MTNQEFIESVTLPNEEWRDVVGFEGYYMVSSFGRVASMPRISRCGISIRPKILKINRRKMPKTNYYVTRVYLSKDQKDYTTTIARIVAKAFIPNPECKSEVDHIDGDTSNNHVANLRWCSRIENMRNPITLARRPKPLLGKPNTWENKPVVCLKGDTLIGTFRTIRETDNIFPKVLKQGVSGCCRGLHKTHAGFRWMYLSDYEALNQ